MITDLANLGPSLRGTTDLGSARAKDIGKTSTQTGQPDKASSFDQVLKTRESDKDVKAQTLKKDSASVASKTEGMADKVPADKAEISSNKNEPRTARKNNESWDEPGSVKTKGQSETVGEKSNTTPTREQVMLQFMDSMESEFGIPPQEIVAAMTQIPEGEQLKSPEASASQVIAQLELPTEEQQKALALYVGMLAQLQQVQQPTQPKLAMPVLAGAATAPALMTETQRRDALNRSLDQMNQKFFMQGAARPKMPVEKTLAPEIKGQMTDPSLMDALPKDEVSFGKLPQMNQMPDLAGKDDLLDSPAYKDLGALKGQALPEGMEKIDPNSQEGQQLLKSLAALGAAAAALNQDMKADPRTAQAFMAEQSMNGMGLPMQAVSGNENGLPFGSEEEDQGGLGKESSQDSFFPTQGAGHLSQSARAEVSGSDSQNFKDVMTGMGAAGAGAMAAGEKSPAENQANVQALMKQAQYMIKKGGGEAKIQMAPEGVGQINMKVVVSEGKVNLEMTAETKEAKKLIESSMNDLKASLSQHRLTMDQVKVDVGNQASSDNKNSDAQQQQRQMDMRQDQQSKDQTRQFWSEYSQNGGFDRRGTFQDSPGIRAYGGSRQPAALTPSSPGAVADQRYTGSGKGRGLNLVA